MTNSVFYTEKLTALKSYLINEEGFSPEELAEPLEMVYNDVYDTFEIVGREYKVYDEEEARNAVEVYIQDTLWAFNADFILQHTKFYEESNDWEDEHFCKALESMQSDLCESANSIVYALIADMDEFISDAIDADGAGAFLSGYDGKEHESSGFYIYRTN